MLVTLLGHNCYIFKYVLTLYRYILAYRNIFCIDIYLLEVRFDVLMRQCSC